MSLEQQASRKGAVEAWFRKLNDDLRSSSAHFEGLERTGAKRGAFQQATTVSVHKTLGDQYEVDETNANVYLLPSTFIADRGELTSPRLSKLHDWPASGAGPSEPPVGPAAA